jgi:hypothetical protein
VLKLVLKQMVLTCSEVTKIDVRDVQQMSQMANLSEVWPCKRITAAAVVVAPASFGILVWENGYISTKRVLQVGKC